MSYKNAKLTLQEAIDEAVAKERERCAKVADAIHHNCCGVGNDTWCCAEGLKVADAIRKVE